MNQDPMNPDASILAVSHGLHDVVAAARSASQTGERAALALVVATTGSTYVRTGAAALFAASGQVGWLSGGCLEPEIARHALLSADDGRVRWLQVDTRDDADLLSGSAVGCRGMLTLALLPLPLLPGITPVLATWLHGGAGLDLDIAIDGDTSVVQVRCADCSGRWHLASDVPQWLGGDQGRAWSLHWPAPPQLMVFGAGPETAALLLQVRALGWKSTLVEGRERWQALAAWADHYRDDMSSAVAADMPRMDAALVMHHHFELDRQALAALADSPAGFIGLLGPPRRREDLFRVLPATVRERLQARLHSPVGLALGGHGPQAIALSIAAQLQAWHHKER